MSNNWEKVHCTNFFCTNDTKLRSFYFKIFHKSIGLNEFLFRIKRVESPNCIWCNKNVESLIHLFCECEKVTPIWLFLTYKISQFVSNLNVTNFEKLFGVTNDKFITYLFLLLKYHIYSCRFTDKLPNIDMFKSSVKKQKELEYSLAKKRNRLPIHFKKWRFDVTA